MPRYDGFISYSHAGDGRLAPRLQSGLERYARPWWKRRMLRIFRDETGLSASPHLWSSIADALDDSEWFLLLASTEGAASVWVGREIEHWVAHRDPSHILLVITDGVFAWDEAAHDIDWERSTRAHPALRGVFGDEPRHVDLTWARAEVAIDRRNGRFQDALAELAAPLRGIPKDELAGEDVRQHRRTIRLARGAVAALALLTLTAVAAGVLAVGQRNEARDQRAAAEAQRDRADAEALTATARGAAAHAVSQSTVALDRALLLGAAAAGLQPSDETSAGLLAAFDAASALQAIHREPGQVAGLAAAAAGDRLATASRDGTIATWALPGFTPVNSTATLADTNLYTLEYVAGDTRLVIAVETGMVVLDAVTLQPVTPVFEPSELIDPPAVVGDIGSAGTTLALGQLGSVLVEVRSTDDGSALAEFSLPGDLCFGGVRGLDVHDGTGRIAVACDSMVAIYDIATDEIVYSEPFILSNAVTFSPDGSVLTIGFITDQLTLLDTRSFETIDTIADTPGSRPYTIAFDASGFQIAVGSDSGDLAVYVLEAANPEEFVPDSPPASYAGVRIVHSFTGQEGGVLALSFGAGFGPGHVLAGGPAGVFEWNPVRMPAIATQRFSLFDGSAGYGYELIDIPMGELYRPNPGPDPERAVYDVLDFAGQPVRTVAIDGATRLLDVDGTAGLLLASGVPEWPPTDGAAGLVTPTRLTIHLVDPRTGTVTRSLDVTPDEIPIPDWAQAAYSDSPEMFAEPHYEPSVEARLGPGGRRLVVQVDTTMTIWDLTTNTALATEQLFFGLTYDWSPDGTMLVVGKVLGGIDVYSSDDLALVTSIDVAPGFSVSNVKVSESLDRVLITAESGEVHLFDNASRTVDPLPFQASGIQLQASVASHDGTMLGALDRDGQLYLWKVSDRSRFGPPILVFTPSAFLSADLDTNEEGLVMTKPGESVAIIPVDPASWIASASALAGRELTAEEWQLYVGEREQRPCG